LQINIIRISRQLQYFEQYQQRVSGLIGAEQAQRLVNQALVLITLGGNDFVNNYFLVPFSARSRQFALPDYVVYLISEYRKILLVYILFSCCYYTIIFYHSFQSTFAMHIIIVYTTSTNLPSEGVVNNFRRGTLRLGLSHAHFSYNFNYLFFSNYLLLKYFMKRSLTLSESHKMIL